MCEDVGVVSRKSRPARSMTHACPLTHCGVVYHPCQAASARRDKTRRMMSQSESWWGARMRTPVVRGLGLGYKD
jgi:hypothetical protein